MTKHNITKQSITAQTTVTRLSHDGRGIAQINGKKTFIENALPGETVTFTYTKRHGRYDEGKATEIHIASPDRVEPLCQHFTICGGCALQHMSSNAQLELKQQMLLEQLQHFGGVQPKEILPPITANHWGYRRKARLGVKYVNKKETVLVGFREKNGRYLADLTHCEVLHPKVGNLIEPLKQLIKGLKAYQQIPQIEVAIGDDATALIFRHMEPLINEDLQQLINFAQQHQFDLYLQPGKPETIHIIWPPEKVQRLHYQLPAYQIEYSFHPTDFTQVNYEINQQMVARALELLQPHNTDQILDLFCGLGNFTLPIAKQAAAVVGIEGSNEMVERATKNAANNNITNIQFYAANLTESLTSASWMQKSYDKILLDPPRTGALEIIKQLPALNAKRIVYISCNPSTLARDAGELITQGYKLLKAGIMDMFPHTHHVEAIALFEK